jgi:hypothetical protein
VIFRETIEGEKMSKLIFIRTLLVLLLNLVICACTVGGSGGAGGASEGSSTSISISGAVVGSIVPDSGVDNSVVANAQVKVESHPEITATTDSQGHYAINNVDPGEYTLYISSAILAGQSVDIKSGSSYGVKIENVVVTAKSDTTIADKTMKKTGSVTGIIEFFQNPNNIDKTGTDVYVPGTDFIAKTSASGAFTLLDLPEGTYDIRMDHLGFQSFTLKDVVVTSGQVTNVGTKLLDLSKGPQGSLAIDSTSSNYLSTQTSGADHAIFKSRTVPLQISYNADAVWMKISDESAFLNKQLEVVSTTKNWNFTSDGLKRIYIQFYDLNALPSSTYYLEFYVDTEAPSLTAVSIMNGWEIVANHLQVPISISTSDKGSGIKEILISNTCAALSGTTCTSITTGSWVPYSSTKLWDLTSADGLKTVYVKTRDYTNLESSIKSDNINKNNFTRIYATTYTQDITLAKQQSPYVIADDTTFRGSVIIEPGVTITILNQKKIIFSGSVTAVGGSALANQIKFQSESGACDANRAYLDMSQADPGVSELNSFDYVTFLGAVDLKLNGGIFNHSQFDSTCTSSTNFGSIEKIRTDNLKITNSTFNHWTEIKVSDGDSNSEVSSNTGSIAYFLKQTGTSTNTIVTNNTNLTILQDVYEITNGSFSPTGTTINGSCANGYYFTGTSMTTGEVISIRDPSPPNCTVVYGGFTNGTTINIRDSVLANCNTFSSFQGSTGANVNFTSINASCSYITYQQGGFNVQFIDSTLTASTALVYCGFMGDKCVASFNRSSGASNLACAQQTVGSYCDFFYRVAQGPSVAMVDSLSIQNSTVSCGNRCRGFSYVEPSNSDQSGNTKTAAFTLTLAGNTWTFPNSETQRRPSNSTNWTVGAGIQQFETATPETYVPNSFWLYNFRNVGSNKYITVTPTVTYSDGN